LTWAFFDRELDTLFPRGELADSCELRGRRGDQARLYELEVRLTVSGPCGDDEPVDSCPVVAQERFSCDRFRGYLPEVPSSEDPYLMSVEVVVVPEDADAFVAGPECVAVAGPRERTVLPGRITDLATYQLIVDAVGFGGGASLGSRLDLEACAG